MARRRFSTSLAQWSHPRNPLPATFMRGGTSKGIYLDARDVSDKSTWTEVFSRLMGSPDPYARQLNGMGGGLSSLSKICVVAPSTRSGIDVDYTFVQVGIKEKYIDLTGNCGNLSSGIGPFALHAGMVQAAPKDADSMTLSLFNTNTSKRVDTTFPVKRGMPDLVGEGGYVIDGVAGAASRISLDFVSPAGARTGKLLPTGNASDTIRLPDSDTNISVTLLDCTNPTVYVLASELGLPNDILPDSITAQTLKTLEYIRQQGAIMMGLDPKAQAQPKIAMVGPPHTHKLISGETQEGNDVDLIVRAISMQQPHRAVPITIAMATGVAARIQGTVVSNVARKTDGDEVRVGHPSGKVAVGANFSPNGEVLAAKVYRTARILMSGDVYW